VIEFTPIADGVLVARTSPLDVATSLVIGDTSALVIDTLSTGYQAEALVRAVRELTALPLVVLNTHAHFDHWFGNALVAPAGEPVWAHRNAIDTMIDDGDREPAASALRYRREDPVFADGIAAVTLRPANRAIRGIEVLDLGGRSVSVAHHGRGHTNGDLVATVQGTGVIFAGDLVEEGAPPSFGSDSYPLEWPDAVAALLADAAADARVVPGHGAVLDLDRVREQHDQLAAFAWLIREGHADGASAEAVAARSPWPAEACLGGVNRGFANLDDPVAP